MDPFVIAQLVECEFIRDRSTVQILVQIYQNRAVDKVFFALMQSPVMINNQFGRGDIVWQISPPPPPCKWCESAHFYFQENIINLSRTKQVPNHSVKIYPHVIE